MYQIQKQFLPGNDQIWVAQLTPEDPIYEYTSLEEADYNARELEVADASGRKYRAVEIY
jgi:hypothetical protein